MSTVEKAVLIAVQAHRGQKDKAGQPYVLHPLRLMLRMTSDPARMTAVLHDVLEDSAVTSEGLRREGFPEEVLAALDCLTRREGEPYEHFIQRIEGNDLARQVKIADLEDNMDMKRLRVVGDRDLRRLAKYHQAWRVLTLPSQKNI